MRKLFKTALLLVLILQIFSTNNVVAQSFIKKDTPIEENTEAITPTPAKVVEDTTKKEPDRLFLEATIASRYLWRGIEFGAGAPSLQAYMTYRIAKGLEIGAISCLTTNGTKVGLGNTLEIFAKYSYKKFYVLVDDYYFFADSTKFDNYVEYGENTNHFMEAVVGYDSDKFDAKLGYYFYGNKAAGTMGETIYAEVSYSPNPAITLFMGAVTGPSYLNFADRGGITSVGVTGTRKIKVTDDFSFLAKGSLVINPNYKYVANVPGVNGNYINYILSFVF